MFNTMRRWDAIFVCALFAGCGAPSSPTNSAQPAALELVSVIRDDAALNRAHDVELQENLAFVPGKGGSLAIIDIADPANPRLLSSLVELGDAETVMPLGNVLLLGTGDFHAIDISDPSNPTILKTIDAPPEIDRINGMAKIGRYVFSADKSGFIGVFDVENSADPQYLGSYPAHERSGQRMPHDVAALGERIVVVNTYRDAEASFRVYRVMDGEQLLPFDKWMVEGGIPSWLANRWDIGGSNRVAVGRQYAYVGAFIPDRVASIDLSDFAAPKQADNIPFCDIDATGMTLAGQVLFVSGGECVEAIDVSNPNRMISLAQLRGGKLFPTRRLEIDGGEPRYDNGHDLVFRDGLLYVTAQNDNLLGIIRVNDERILELAGRDPL